MKFVLSMLMTLTVIINVIGIYPHAEMLESKSGSLNAADSLYVYEEEITLNDQDLEGVNSFIDSSDPSESTRAGAIESGVYSISKANTTSYMRCNTANGGTYLSQQSFTSLPASQSQKHAMFKIVYRPITADYVIRNMVNNEVIIYPNPNYESPLSLRMPETRDDSISSDKTWKISTSTDGFYYIYRRINGVTYYMYMPDSGVIRLTTDKSTDGTKWAFNQYTGTTFRGWGKLGDWPDHIHRDTRTTPMSITELFEPFFSVFARKYLDFKFRCIISI